MCMNRSGCFCKETKDTSGKGTIMADNNDDDDDHIISYHDDDDDILLLSDVSQESVGGRMVSTPLLGHPAAIDISDVISSIHGRVHLLC